MSQSVAQVKGILIHSALEVETEVEQSVGFLVWHSLPAPSVLSCSATQVGVVSLRLSR